jgi:hypothetical protein
VKAAFERANESAQPHALGTVVLQQLQKQTGQITYWNCLIVAKIDLVLDYKQSNQSPNLSSYFREWLNWSRLSRREPLDSPAMTRLCIVSGRASEQQHSGS